MFEVFYICICMSAYALIIYGNSDYAIQREKSHDLKNQTQKNGRCAEEVDLSCAFYFYYQISKSVLYKLFQMPQ